MGQVLILRLLAMLIMMIAMMIAMMIVMMIAMMIEMTGVDLATAGNADGQANPALCAGCRGSGKFLTLSIGYFFASRIWVIFLRQ